MMSDMLRRDADGSSCREAGDLASVLGPIWTTTCVPWQRRLTSIWIPSPPCSLADGVSSTTWPGPATAPGGEHRHESPNAHERQTGIVGLETAAQQMGFFAMPMAGRSASSGFLLAGSTASRKNCTMYAEAWQARVWSRWNPRAGRHGRIPRAVPASIVVERNQKLAAPHRADARRPGKKDYLV